MINHIKRWIKWQKQSGDAIITKIMVLFGFVTTPTFLRTMTDKQERELEEFLWKEEEKWKHE